MLKKVLNLHEEAVNQKLRTVCDKHGAAVYAKVRAVDILPIDGSGVSHAEYSFALRSHFDFVVTDREHNPLFAVEFDGPAHESGAQVDRDRIKNGLAERFGLPLLRVRSDHLLRRYDGWDLLSWMVDVWFLQSEADRMYAEGQLPWDFDFNPTFIIRSPDHKRRFPYWLGVDAQLKMLELYKRGQVLDATPSIYHGLDTEGNHRALAFVRVNRESGVMVKVSMRSQQFPVDLSEPIRGVLFNDLHNELRVALADPARRRSLSCIDGEVQTFTFGLRMLSWSGYAQPKGEGRN